MIDTIAVVGLGNAGSTLHLPALDGIEGVRVVGGCDPDPEARDRVLRRWGVPVFTVSMAAGLLLGIGLHFLIENPDHVSALPAGAWRVPFQLSAGGVTLTPRGGAVLGGWQWARR